MAVAKKDIKGLIFDLKNMTMQEMKNMFMHVSIKSLKSWQTYYAAKGQVETCKMIKEIEDFKNGPAAVQYLSSK
jgi:hypothetical protein